MLTDIDDTLTDHGRLPARSYQAMEQLHDAGLVVVPVTGRPAGWCDLIARQWPVSAVVGENGAFWFSYDHASRRMTRHFVRDHSQRRSDHDRLDAIARDVFANVSGTAYASDQDFRAVDVAIDHCEDVAPLGPSQIDRIIEQFTQAGAMAKVSSIHVNAWFGDHDKLSTSLELLHDHFGIDASSQPEIVLYAGDSPNDEPMFAHFPNAVGVANVIEFADRMATLPAYVTRFRSARGFAEIADVLLSSRSTKTLSGREHRQGPTSVDGPDHE